MPTRRGKAIIYQKLMPLPRHPHEVFPALNDIAHPLAQGQRPVERFDGTVLQDFFQPKLRCQLSDGVEPRQADLDA